MCKMNEGPADRIMRVLVGAILIGAALVSLAGLAKIVALVLGLVAFVTGAVGFCPLYTVLGITTVPHKKK